MKKIITKEKGNCKELERKFEKKQRKLKAFLERTKHFNKGYKDLHVTGIQYSNKFITSIWHIQKFQKILTNSQKDWQKIERKYEKEQKEMQEILEKIKKVKITKIQLRIKTGDETG